MGEAEEAEGEAKVEEEEVNGEEEVEGEEEGVSPPSLGVALRRTRLCRRRR